MIYEIKSNIIIDNDTVSSLLFHLPSYLALKKMQTTSPSEENNFDIIVGRSSSTAP